MIIYNGVALETVAPVMVEDVRVSPIQMSAVARQRPIRWGSDFVRLGGGSRTVAVTFALIDENPESRAERLAAVTRWARSDTPVRLEVPGHIGRHIECLCTSLPEPSTRQWWESKLRLVFTTFDNPYWTDNAERTAACGTAFYAEGTAPPLMRIEATLTGTGNNVTYSDGTNTMAFTGLGAGALVIDLDKQTAALGGVSVMSAYGFNSRFIIPRAGRQTITGTGTVKFVQRWD